ncbi:autotransporter outer membrane beta-barrel domain-containing protein [Magnetococcus sp. PR-3]|uniref:autotransporter outer membrane beta-barrel domain-containing protein n=1 Tax=Magnetococcus sp. PR-3 TaxID=3120355 RepID=UPI002FCE4959
MAQDVATNTQAAITTVSSPVSVSVATKAMSSVRGLIGSGLSTTAGASGDRMAGVGVWAKVGNTNVDSDVSGMAYDGNTVTGLIGVDKKMNANLVIGAALMGENTDLDTTFNTGTFEASGVSFMPYVRYTLPNRVDLVGLAGISRLSNDTKRGAVTGSYDSTRFMMQAGGSKNFVVKNEIVVRPSLGMTYVHTRNDAFTESDATAVAKDTQTVSWADVGVHVSRTYGKHTPFLNLTGNYFVKAPESTLLASGQYYASDKGSLGLGLGNSIAVNDHLSLSLEANAASITDSDVSIFDISGQLRWQW